MRNTLTSTVIDSTSVRLSCWGVIGQQLDVEFSGDEIYLGAVGPVRAKDEC